MPSRRPRYTEAVNDLLRAHERIVTHAQLIEVGMPQSTISHRIGPRGPWRRMHPGVVLAHHGTPTRREQLLAALAYAGPGSLITGADALRLHGLRNVGVDDIRMLVAADRHRTSRPGVIIERTHHLPLAVDRRGVPCAAVPRALFDDCRTTEALDRVRETVAATIQQRFCTVDDLTQEVTAGPTQRTALSRSVLGEVGAGIRSVAEARARELIQRFGLPEPRWNCELVTDAGEVIAVPDAFWDVGVVLEIDSLQWHLTPADYKRTQARQRRMAELAIIVIPSAPGDIIESPVPIFRQVAAALQQASYRDRPLGVTVVERTPAGAFAMA